MYAIMWKQYAPHMSADIQHEAQMTKQIEALEKRINDLQKT
jgi:hypothetical protein